MTDDIPERNGPPDAADDATDAGLRRWGDRARRDSAELLTAVTVPSGGRPRGRAGIVRWAVPAAAVLVAAAIVIPIALTRGVRSEPTTGAANPPVAPGTSVPGRTVPSSVPKPTSGPTTTAAAPGTGAAAQRTASPGVGQQAITYHGLTVDVPASWKLNDYACGPRSDTVLLPGPRDSCGPPPQTVTTVEFVGWPTAGIEPENLTHTDGVLDGSTANLAAGWKDNGGLGGKPGPRLWVRMISIPDLRAVVVVTSPDRARADRIAGTARIVDVDSAGCDVQAPDTLALPGPTAKGAPPLVSGADSAVIPGHPTKVSVCRYDNGLLEHGMFMGPETDDVQGTSIAALQAILARAPIGTYRIPTTSYSTDVCRNPNLPVGEPSPLRDDGEGYRIQAQYPDGAGLTAIARINLCGDLGVTNGEYTVQPTVELANWLARLGSGGYAGPLPGSGPGTAQPTS